MRPFLVRQITRISQPAAVVTFAVCGDQTRAVPIREHAIAEGLSSQDNGHSRSDDRLLAWKIAMQAAIEQGADIVPSRTMVREWDEPRHVADSQRGRFVRFAIKRLEQLIEAYRKHELPQY